ncbi:MAG: hypothetical protein NTZ18_00800 [Candidatus Komeilibacteria bacterium]|nr:hypothetical protein [Candidatus Komeilibacteria bacterium]
MNKFEAIQPEQLKERPQVFTPESYKPVLGLAGRLLRLEAPLNQEEIAGLQSVGELSSLVDERTGKLVEAELTEILAKGNYSEEQKQFLIEAAANRNFDDLPENDQQALSAALGLTLVAERARSNTTAKILKELPAETLERFNMTAEQRDLLAMLLKLITKVNTEYLRHNARLTQEIPYSEMPLADQMRERRFLANGFDDITAAMEKMSQGAHEPVFGSLEKDRAFLKYLTDLKNAYTPFTEGTNQPINASAQQELLARAQESFLALHNGFPEFPLIVFPAFSHYEADEVATDDWSKYGFDPEIRLHWQRQEQQAKHKDYERLKGQFASTIDNRFSDIADTDFVKRYQVIFGDTALASGVNLKGAPLAQAEGNVILIIETSPDKEEEKKLDEAVKSLLSKSEDRAIIDSPQFRALADKINALHEFGHGLYDEKSPAAEKLGGLDDKLAEYKSELAMWSTATSILSKEVKASFGEQADQALLLAMLKEAFRFCRKEKTEPEYYLADKNIVEILIKAGVISETVGKIELKSDKLNKDLEGVFSEELRKILQIYHEADQGDIKAAKSEARLIAGNKPSETFKKIKKFIK